jgi:hypothetical protein
MLMSEINYEEKLEYKLIGEFKRLFYRKMGYEPVVISRNHKELDPTKDGHYELKPVNLKSLREWFNEITPFKSGERLKLETRKRYREVVHFRMIYSFIARMMGHSFVGIGRALGRDHSTIMHNVQTTKDLLETNPQFRQIYSEIFEYIKEKIQKNDSKLLECSNQTQDNDEPTLLS